MSFLECSPHLISYSPLPTVFHFPEEGVAALPSMLPRVFPFFH